MMSHSPKCSETIRLQQDRIERLEQERVRLNRLKGEVEYELDKAYCVARYYLLA